jgi:hypothetical protein
MCEERNGGALFKQIGFLSFHETVPDVAEKGFE